MRNGLRRYIVYDRHESGLPVVIDGTAAECAAVMGIDVQTFYQYLVRRGSDSVCGRWEIHKCSIEEIAEVLG